MKLPLIIAEIGNCHEGSLEVALELVSLAKEAGADLVKFQAGRAEGFSRTADDIERYRKYELSLEGYWKLAEFARSIEIEPFFSVWNEEFNVLLDFPQMWRKIPSRQCERSVIARFSNLRTFISIPHWFTEDQVRNLNIGEGIPLHCVTEYPAIDPMLNRIIKIKDWTGLRTGYSDHTIGIESAISAVKDAGAIVIEKHFTKAHDFGPLRDHALAATPLELANLIKAVKFDPE